MVSEYPDGKYLKLFESRNLIDGSDSHVRQKRFSFPRISGLKIFVIAAKAVKTQKLRVRDGLLGVVRMEKTKTNCVSH